MPTNASRSNDAIPALRADMRAVGRSAFARGMVWGTSGNISGKLPDGSLLLSKAGTDLADLADDDFVIALPGFDDAIPPEVTSEVCMHRAAHAAGDDVRCVLHLSPTWVTLAATTGIAVPITATAEAHLMLAGLTRVPWACPGTPDLGHAVATGLMNGTRALILEGHGALTLGRTPREALLRMETLEFVARLAILAHQSGLPLIAMHPAQRTQVSERYGNHGT
ncbi:MAG: class II aldolase/adducin family protein [Thermomicrobiales bacterium]